MSYYGGYQRRIRFGGRLTPTVRALLIANVAVFGAQLLLHIAAPSISRLFQYLFALTPALAIGRLHVWQFVTYAFLHELGVLPFHLFFNMLFLWIFGGDVERALGRTRFLKLYFGGVLAAGLCMCMPPMWHIRVLGASGAVFAVMAMYGRLFPHRTLLVWGLFPVRARTLVLVLVAIEVFFLVASGGHSKTAHLAHLGGFAFGWLFPQLERAVQGFRERQASDRVARRREEEREVREKVDELLAKVGREGLNSLTKREREFLKRASKTFRG
ncbi:MAG: rhomboid family intramembrane serine protease [Planctomycetota bacterium]